MSTATTRLIVCWRDADGGTLWERWDNANGCDTPAGCDNKLVQESGLGVGSLNHIMYARTSVLPACGPCCCTALPSNADALTLLVLALAAPACVYQP